MEDPLTMTRTSLRSRAFIAALLAFVLGLAALIALGGSSSAPAAQTDAQRDCRGHIEKGEADPDDPESTQVKYILACSGPITGYSILPEKQVTGFESEIFATDKTSKEVVPTDAFGCTGDVPGYGVNCVGAYGGEYRVITGTFAMNDKLCDEPRVDPLVIVAVATKDAKGNVVQAMAGPFDLGRPHGCPKSARGGTRRIPKDTDQILG
jgi:hypothetical protein